MKQSQVDKTLVKRLNLIGQEIDSQTKGHQLLIYSDGTYETIIKE